MLLAAGVLWGGSGSAGRMLNAVGHLSSMQVASARALIGGLGLVAVGALLRRPLPQGTPAFRRIGAMAALTVVFQACFFAAVSLGSISIATLVTLATTPVTVTIVQAIRRHHVRASAVGIVALALAGLALLVGPSPAGGPVLLVALLGAAAGVSFATMTLINAHPAPGGDPLSMTGVAFLVGGLALLAAAFALPGTPPVPWSAPLVGWLVVLGLVCTAAPYGLYFTGLLRASAALGALFALLEPLTATLIASLAFGERLTPAGWLGAALLVSAVAMAAVVPGDH